ncbi:MAG: sec-independent translocase [Chloroflexi bacterium ADurb.Bin222]|nr:MAG: sec-independent translocase [Chloroflexi bacterium ADurb.Bin222]
MDFFNIGTPELLVILLIGLLLFGPEELVKFARTASHYLRSAQQLWREVAAQLTPDLTAPAADPPADNTAMPTAAADDDLPAPDETAPPPGYGP